MEYNFREIEPRWQKEWERRRTYRVDADASRPKYYVLDMFPYPSGAGLHVGHPLGYIASDIYTRYKRLCGFNVLHPMGFDAFGLPAEQYAIQTGQHPAVTTAQNVARYREQLDKLGFSYDWDRQVVTSDPAYYRWTQWAFLKMFDSYYCYDRAAGAPHRRTDRGVRPPGNGGAACRLYRADGVHRRRMECDGRETATGGVAELPAGLPGRHDGELVRRARYGACQRRGGERPFGAGRFPGSAEAHEAVAAAGERLCRTAARRHGAA